MRIRLQLKKLGGFRLGLIILTIGIFLGIVFSNIFRGFYWNQMDLINTSYLSDIRNINIDYPVLLRYVLWKNFKIFILFWVFCSTALGIPYILISILYAGIQCGFFLSVLLMKFGLKGILLAIGYTFPQYLIYIFVALLCLRSGYLLCKSMYYDTKMGRRGRMERIAKQLVLIIILGAILAVGSLTEAYIGSFFLQKILYFFS